MMSSQQIQCPKCSSFDTRKGGFNASGRQRYKCKNCGRLFVEGFHHESKPILNIKCSGCGQTNNCVCEQLAIEKTKMKIALNLDSCLDVPCFFCLKEDFHCIEECENLESFLRSLSC